MTLANDINKRVSIKRETTYGVAPTAPNAWQLRRVKSTLDIKRDTYQSNEIDTTYQRRDKRLGARRAPGRLEGELSPTTYADIISAVLRKDFAAVSALNTLTLTISGTGPTYTIARSAGSWLTAGVKVGDVWRITAGSFNAANLNKNLAVMAVTALNLTVRTLNGSALVAEGPIASATVTFPGKKSFIPTTGHTDISYSLEHWYPLVGQMELYTGVVPTDMDVDLPATGMTQIGFGLLGQDMNSDTAAYYSSPTALTSTGIVAAVNGMLLFGGNKSAICTGLKFKVAGGHSGDPVVGSNTIPKLFQGQLEVSGQFSAYFEDAVLRDAFLDETDTSIIVYLTTSEDAAADFLSFVMPRVKLLSADKGDSSKATVQTFEFDSLLNTAGGTGTSTEATSLSVQDSAAP